MYMAEQIPALNLCIWHIIVFINVRREHGYQIGPNTKQVWGDLFEVP